MVLCFCWWSSTGIRLSNKSTARHAMRLVLLSCMIFPMLPFCLYLATGLITGFHVCTLLALAAYGVPFNPVELVSLLGSLCLLIAAYLSLFKPCAAARLALLASLATWCFYGPAIRTKLHKQSSVLREHTLSAPTDSGVWLAVAKSAVEREGGFISAHRIDGN